MHRHKEASMDENKGRDEQVTQEQAEENMSFPIDRTFESQPVDNYEVHEAHEEENPAAASAEEGMSFPIDRTFEQAPKNDYSLYNIRPDMSAPRHAAYEEKPPIYEENGQMTPPPKKKSNGWKIAAIIIAAVMFGCALGVAVILPAAQMLGLVPDTAQNDAQPPQNDENNQPNQPSTTQNDKIVRDYSNVKYPDKLPEYDGKSVTVTDKYNPVPEIAEQISDSVVGVSALNTAEDGSVTGSRGTGMIISSEGYIITNEHVISSGKDITVTLNDGTEYEGTLMGVDENLDIAVIKIDAKNLCAIKLGTSETTKAGERVIAVGNPSGAGANLTGTVTVGYVSAVNREILFNDTRQKFIQTDAAVNPGNSGGPLVNERGEVIGVVTLKSLVSTVEQDGTMVNAEGIGFAIPIDKAMKSVESIILSGDVKRPGLGVKVYEVDKEQAQANELHEGLMIDSFISGSLAQKAGLEVGDIVIECDGETITALDQFQEILGSKMVGDHVKLTVWRNGQTMEFDIELSDMNKIG